MYPSCQNEDLNLLAITVTSWTTHIQRGVITAGDILPPRIESKVFPKADSVEGSITDLSAVVRPIECRPLDVSELRKCW